MSLRSCFLRVPFAAGLYVRPNGNDTQGPIPVSVESINAPQELHATLVLLVHDALDLPLFWACAEPGIDA